MTTDDGDPQDTSERSFHALAIDGDIKRDMPRQDAFEWADEHLEMLESLDPDSDHWVQVTSHRPGSGETDE